MDTSLFYEYFVKPIISPEVQGYNLVNTVVYITLLIGACALIYYLLNKKIEFNSKFFISIIPYILFGISLRVIMHQIEGGSLFIYGLSKTPNPLELGFWFFTPGVWIATFILVVVGLLLAGVLKKDKPIDYRVLFTVGAIAAAIPLVFNIIHFNNWTIFLTTAALIAIVAYGVCYAINKFTKYKILEDKLNLFIVTGQAIDGIASSIAITYFNFSEQHVFSNMVMNINPLLFVIIKVVLAILICWSLDDYLKEEKKDDKEHPFLRKHKKNLVGFIKVVIAILGFATGLASLFKLGIIF